MLSAQITPYFSLIYKQITPYFSLIYKQRIKFVTRIKINVLPSCLKKINYLSFSPRCNLTKDL